MNNNTTPKTTKPVRLAWVLHSTLEGQEVHKASHAGGTICRISGGPMDDAFVVFDADFRKVGEAASVGQARKLAERADND